MHLITDKGLVVVSTDFQAGLYYDNSRNSHKQGSHRRAKGTRSVLICRAD